MNKERFDFDLEDENQAGAEAEPIDIDQLVIRVKQERIAAEEHYQAVFNSAAAEGKIEEGPETLKGKELMEAASAVTLAKDNERAVLEFKKLRDEGVSDEEIAAKLQERWDNLEHARKNSADAVEGE